MAHLDKLPTYFVKGDDRRVAYYTVTARELLADGYVEEKGTEPEVTKKPDKQPEIAVEAGQDAFDLDSFKPEENLSVELNLFTKAELVEYAASHGVELDISERKIELLNACKEIQENG